MPRRRNRNKPNRRRRPKGRRHATGIRTAVSPGNRYRTLLSDNVSSSGSIGSVTQLQLILKGSRWSGLFNKASQVKINRIGITLLPMTYLEFVVRGINAPLLDNRAELVNQPDAIKAYSPSRPRTYWFRPNQNMAKGWLDIESSSATFNSGLWIYYTGQNQLNNSGSEILFQIQYDASFQGIDFLSV